MTPRPAEDETLDAFFRGRVRILQKRRGYRFSMDAPLLADFVRVGPDDECLEIGAGCGIVSLLLSVKPFRRITALEIQEDLAGLARRNMALNNQDGRIAVLRQDYRTFEPERPFDVIFSNPPYMQPNAGLLSPSGERSAARHELHGGIDDIMRRTRDWLAPEGRAYFVFPDRRRADFLGAAARADLALAGLRDVHPRLGRPASVFLAEVGRAGRGPARVHEPLVLYDGAGTYSREAEAIFQGRTAA